MLRVLTLILAVFAVFIVAASLAIETPPIETGAGEVDPSPLTTPVGAAAETASVDEVRRARLDEPPSLGSDRLATDAADSSSVVRGELLDALRRPLADVHFEWSGEGRAPLVVTGRTTADGQWELPAEVLRLPDAQLRFELSSKIWLDCDRLIVERLNEIVAPEFGSVIIETRDTTGVGDDEALPVFVDFSAESPAGDLSVHEHTPRVRVVVRGTAERVSGTRAEFRLPKELLFTAHCFSDHFEIAPERRSFTPPDTLTFTLLGRRRWPIARFVDEGIEHPLDGRAYFQRGGSAVSTQIREDCARIPRADWMDHIEDVRITAMFDDGRLLDANSSDFDVDSSTGELRIDASRASAPHEFDSPFAHVVLVAVADRSGSLGFVAEGGPQDPGLPFWEKRDGKIRLYRPPEGWQRVLVMSEKGDTAYIDKGWNKLIESSAIGTMTLDFDRDVAPLVETHGSVTVSHCVEFSHEEEAYEIAVRSTTVSSAHECATRVWKCSRSPDLRSFFVLRYEKDGRYVRHVMDPQR